MVLEIEARDFFVHARQVLVELQSLNFDLSVSFFKEATLINVIYFLLLLIFVCMVHVHVQRPGEDDGHLPLTFSSLFLETRSLTDQRLLQAGRLTSPPGSCCFCPCCRALGTQRQSSSLLWMFHHARYFLFVLVVSCLLMFQFSLCVLGFNVLCIIFLIEIVTSIQVTKLVSTFFVS